MKGKHFFKDPQNIIAIGVTLISLCALIVSLEQTSVLKEEQRMMREHYKASVWPHLEVTMGLEHNKEDGRIKRFNLALANTGVGPAIITAVKISYLDSIAHDWWELFDIQGIPDSIERYISNQGFNGKIIQAGEAVNILNLDINVPLANAFLKHAEGVNMAIYYESIYGDCWLYDTNETIEVEDEVVIPESDQFH